MVSCSRPLCPIPSGILSSSQDPQNAGQASLQNWYFQQLLINELLGSRGTDLTLIAPLWLQKEWFPDLLGSLVEPPRMFH